MTGDASHSILSLLLILTPLMQAGEAVAAAPARPAPMIVKLWGGNPPGLAPDAGPETHDANGGVAHVSVPEMAVHLPPAEAATGVALIVCPGGSYRRVGLYHSGMHTIDYFVPKGVAVVVLKYRTAPPSMNVVEDALADAQRAVRLVRHNASDWKIDPKRIGMVGSSAGAHLVLNAASRFDGGDAGATDPIDRQSSRPDFIGLLCPWPRKQTIDKFPIGPESPPAFVASAKDDPIAPTAFAEAIASAYERAGAPVHLWLVERGGHGAFTRKTGEGSQWMDRFSGWLTIRGFWHRPRIESP